MLTRLKRTAAAVLICGLCAGNMMTAMAATKKTETRTPITSVSIRVYSEVKSDYDVNAATLYAVSNSDDYTIGASTFDNGNKEYWEPGDVPKAKIEIHARNGYYFNKVSGAKKFDITGATYSSSKTQNDSETLILSVKLTPASGTLDAPEVAEWVGYPIGKASWEAVPYAGAYELKLNRDGTEIFSVPKVNATTYDFYPAMTQGGRYQFRVRAIPKTTEEQNYIKSGDWVYSEEIDIDDDEASNLTGNNRTNKNITPAQIGWTKDAEGWWYRNADGTYPVNAWAAINGQWYLFDYNGYMLTGWQIKDGKYYFMDSNGAMQIGWLEDRKNWYFLDNSGAMQTGWINVDGVTYYFDANGAMHKGWLLDGGKWYYMNTDNGSLTRNAYIGGYYLNSNGIWNP
ncbi:MAG: N-acetylmuramoyl-L-alanine amidase family protein [Hungatella hathewayi]|nr:N-acetylmuramoyl-L-alanine amidase family protein [Hungatella hathewayi]